jgi:hypothetical protein
MRMGPSRFGQRLAARPVAAGLLRTAARQITRYPVSAPRPGRGCCSHQRQPLLKPWLGIGFDGIAYSRPRRSRARDWERYQARIGVARNFSSRVVISSGTTQNRWLWPWVLLRGPGQPQATDALIVNFAQRQWGVSLAGLAKSWRCIYIEPSSFGRTKLALPAKARLSDELLQNPRLNRQRSRAAITTHIESRKRK